MIEEIINDKLFIRKLSIHKYDSNKRISDSSVTSYMVTSEENMTNQENGKQQRQRIFFTIKFYKSANNTAILFPKKQKPEGK